MRSTAAGPLRQQAAALGYAPLLADVLISVAVVYSEKGMVDEGARLFEEALWTALRCRHDETAAEAATYLVYQVGALQSRADAAEVWSRLAETLLERMGGHETHLGLAADQPLRAAAKPGSTRPRRSMTRGAPSRPRKRFWDRRTPISPTRSTTLRSVSTASAMSPARSISLARAVPIIENGLGADHPRTAWILSNYSELLNRVGRFSEGRDAAARALAVFERESDPQGLFITYALVALGTSALGLGSIEVALPALERANEIRSAKEPDPARRAEARFMLARALWDQGQDRARARALATDRA